MDTMKHGRGAARPIAALALVAALAAGWAALALWPKKAVDTPAAWKAGADGAPLVIAHQGGAMERPSESNLAFEHAAAIGVDAFELDVALTADGVLAVIHDLLLDRTTDGSGRVRNRTYAEIRFLDAGYGLLGPDLEVVRDPAANPYIGVGAYVPSLEELFAAYPDMTMLVELKDAGADGAAAARELRRLVDAYGRADRTLVASFHGETMDAFERLPGAPVARAASTREGYAFLAFHLLGLNAANNGADYEALSVPVSTDLGLVSVDLTSAKLRADVAARGLALYYWTINDRAGLERLTDLPGEGRADGIITDRPGELIEVLKAKGLR